MTPRERWLNCMRGQPVDRVPLSLEGLHYKTRADLENEPDARRRGVAERVFDQVHYDHQVPAYLNRYLITPRQHIHETRRERDGDAERIWSEIETPKGPLTCCTGRNTVTHTCWQVKYPVESLDDIEKIRSVPWERPEGLAPPDTSRLPDDFAARGILRAGVSSPFVCVAAMMPYEMFLELCLTEFALMRDLTQICLERTLDVLDVLLEDNKIEYVWMGGCEWITPPMASPKLYAELVQPFEAQVIERIHAAGAIAHVHCHGNVRDTIDMVLERKADYFEPVEPPPDGDLTFAEAKQIAAGRMTLGGNLEARVLEFADETEMDRAIDAAFSGGTDRMVLHNSAGPIAAFTPVMERNYHRVLDAWESRGTMAVKEESVMAAV